MIQNSSKHWTSEEDNRLRELVVSNAAAFDIAAELGRTVSAVKGRTLLLRLTLGRSRSNRVASQQDGPPGSGRIKRSWTEHEVRQLKELARNNGIEQIAEQLNRSPSSVKLKAFWLNVSLNGR
jgi:hypothetical protein